jgi:hypothetical protein
MASEPSPPSGRGSISGVTPVGQEAIQAAPSLPAELGGRASFPSPPARSDLSSRVPQPS